MQNNHSLSQRLLVSAPVVTLVLLAVYLSPLMWFRPFFALIITAITVGTLKEFYSIARQKGCKPLVQLALGSSCVYMAAVYLATQNLSYAALPRVVLCLSLLSFFLTFFRETATNPFDKLSITLFGIVYIIIPLSYILNIAYPSHNIYDGRWWLLYLITTTKATDTAAYFAGKNLGKRPFLQHLSPKKTVEGAIAGVAAAMFTSAALNILAPNVFHFTGIQSLLLGALTGVIALFGDFAESLLKRDAGVKDSSHLPGLGGILDIMDSVIFTTPTVYTIMILWSES